MKTFLILTICCLTLQNNVGDTSPISNHSPALVSLGVHGLLILHKNGKSATVCDDGFDNRAAKVVCRMLGLPVENAKVLKLGVSGKGGPESMNIILHGIDCTGTEDNIEKCKSSTLWSTCDHTEDVGVSCGQNNSRTVGCRTEGRIGTTTEEKNCDRMAYTETPRKELGKPPSSVCWTYNGKTFYFVSTPKTYVQAQATCQKYGMKVVHVSDNSHNNWLFSKTGATPTEMWWIGLSDSAVEGSFVWDDGQALSYKTWRSGEPNNRDNEDCVEIGSYPNGKWNDNQCSLTLKFICESA